MSSNLNGALEQLENINTERAKLFSDYRYFDEKNPLYYANAAAGEMGELCNMLKKYLRDYPEQAKDKDGSPINPYAICLEAADVIIYLELFCSIWGYSLSSLLQTKFNEVSVKKNAHKDLFITSKQ
jgi:NTP pyrophosphatase (non-canonical NTP hydrolase)